MDSLKFFIFSFLFLSLSAVNNDESNEKLRELIKHRIERFKESNQSDVLNLPVHPCDGFLNILRGFHEGKPYFMDLPANPLSVLIFLSSKNKSNRDLIYELLQLGIWPTCPPLLHAVGNNDLPAALLLLKYGFKNMQ